MALTVKKMNSFISSLVSVVMPTLNQSPFLETAVRSVLEQDYPNVELIVVDGLSTDGTLNLLVKLQREYGNRLRWVSQKDTGPAQAINIALGVARGDIIGWLNSDDMYAQGAVRRAVHFFKRQKSVQLVYGLADHIDIRGSFLGRYPTKSPSTPVSQFADGCFICQPTVFMRRSALEEVGYLDESIKTAFDFELWLRFFKRYPNQIGIVRQVQAYSRLHAACITQKERRQVALDAMAVLSRHFKHVPLHWIWTHVDELCEHYPFGLDKRTLLEQIEAFVTDAKPLLTTNQLKTLVGELRSDRRLALAKVGLMATIQSDGWVSKSVFIKCQWNAKAPKAVLVRCKAPWPEAGKLNLKTTLPSGVIQFSRIDVPDDFILRLEIPEAEKGGCMIWIIETRNGFVPARHDRKSTDRRKLAFQILELAPEI
jgi:glycosyltransferase involved in cell wall biosynthesis